MPPTPPPALRALAPEWTASLAHQLIPDTTTWRLTHADGRVRFAKISRSGRYPTLQGEAERMVWAAAYLPVPTVVEMTERDGNTILITESLPGQDGTDPVWRDDLGALVGALARGLATFHRAVGEEWCPFRFDVERALDHVTQRVAAGEIGGADEFHEEHQHLTPTAGLELLRATAPASEDLVVCHGDYCPPNALLIDGEVTGYVDLGELSVADRWRDIAIGGWSVVWNFGPQYEALFYENYGVEPDPDRIAFYRLLWEMSS